MQFTFARLLIAAVAFATVKAVPLTNTTVQGGDAAAADGNIFFCTDINFGGTCDNFAFTAGECTNLNAPFQDSISSWGPDTGFTCSMFIDSGCSGASLTGSSPGFSSLSSEFNDQFSSFRCNFD